MQNNNFAAQSNDFRFLFFVILGMNSLIFLLFLLSFSLSRRSFSSRILFWHFLFRDQASSHFRYVIVVRTLLRFTRSKIKCNARKTEKTRILLCQKFLLFNSAAASIASRSFVSAWLLRARGAMRRAFFSTARIRVALFPPE